MDAQVLAEVRRLTAAEDETFAAARERAGTMVSSPSPEVGALLRWAAASCDARAAVEVGAAGGVSGLWLLRALPDRGVLTSIEPDPHAHGLATQVFDDAEAGARVRSILGAPETVLERLTDGAYDVMLLQSQPNRYPEALEHAQRLLRPGGVLLARGVLRPGDHAEALATFVQQLAESPAFDAVVLPLEDGIALATRTEDAEPDAG